ncbi:cyclin-P2-1-like [Phragmites australis]|uniref:cyclin-P2-1-like n=1 Tax=Phragmites australis TaxID=29695 RepID=UPI002D79DB76|nr:cyclin-P2-1-like [Phragmites australis]
MASAELPSDMFAFPCRDDGTSTELSPPVVISVLASILERHIALNERALAAGSREAAGDANEAGDNDSAAVTVTRRRVRAFDSGTVLDMSLHAFLERFSRYAHVSPQVYVVAYAYLDRLRRGDAGVRVVRANAQRLLTTAILVASKFVEDRNYKNSYFAAVGGLSAAELSALELDFLFLMQFRLNVCASVFQSYCCHLEREVNYGGGYRVERRPEKAIVCAGEARAQEPQHRQAAAAQ